ncbi:hypothetical protein CC86DRAFT_382663 [Ophiobolus disseminans]|uniref:Uncharacterized protein n=1 Tax=Ophiobolus disseminans TaxID=1469910 RepID=A0A6A6ZX85_9PLEO|nr:hypothetical protein CC86DRAFT_382663 [Ophiobolus disseminans]
MAQAGDPCHPIIELPTKVQRLQFAWLNCGPGKEGGFYDPPTTLGQGLHLVPTTTANTVATKPPASPEQHIPQTPTSTPQSPPKEPAEATATLGASDLSLDPPASIESSSAIPISLQGSSTTIISGSLTLTQTAMQKSLTIHPAQPTVITLPPQPGQQVPSVVTLVVTIITLVAVSSSRLDSITMAPAVPMSQAFAVVLGSQTLWPGNSVILDGSTSTLASGATTVVGGVEVSLDAQGERVVVGRTSTIALRTDVLPSSGPVVLTIGSFMFTVPNAAAGNEVVLGTQSLLPGSSIVVDGTVVSLRPDSATLFINGSPLPLHLAKPMSTPGPKIYPVVLARTTLMPDSLTRLTVGTQTLKMGGVAVMLPRRSLC